MILTWTLAFCRSRKLKSSLFSGMHGPMPERRMPGKMCASAVIVAGERCLCQSVEKELACETSHTGDG